MCSQASDSTDKAPTHNIKITHYVQYTWITFGWMTSEFTYYKDFLNHLLGCCDYHNLTKDLSRLLGDCTYRPFCGWI